MPPTRGSRTWTRLDVPAGAAGLDLLAEAVGGALAGGPPVALIPGYAPVAVQVDLHRRLASTEHAMPTDTAVLCPTSGSTGAPRIVLLSRRALLAAAAARDAALGGVPAAWLVALPAVTAATLIAVVRSHVAGLPLVAWPGIGGAHRFTAADFTRAATDLLAHAGAAGAPARTSLVPAQVARLLADDAAVTALRALDRVLVGGGPLDPALARRALDLGVPITTTYGMTETCGGCVYDGIATPGTQVTLADDGEILLGGDCLADCYLDGPLPLRDGLLRTGDRGRLDDAGVLHVLGRFDDIVTVRGANVDLAAVAAIVTSSPKVREAAVAAEADPAGGHRVVAHVVGSAADADVIRSAVREQLGPAAVPEVRRVAVLPRLPGGKVDTRRLAKGPR